MENENHRNRSDQRWEREHSTSAPCGNLVDGLPRDCNTETVTRRARFVSMGSSTAWPWKTGFECVGAVLADLARDWGLTIAVLVVVLNCIIIKQTFNMVGFPCRFRSRFFPSQRGQPRLCTDETNEILSRAENTHACARFPQIEWKDSVFTLENWLQLL